MGKYSTERDPNGDTDKLFLLQAIANELAEANRLKRYELTIGYKADCIPEELKDQA